METKFCNAYRGKDYQLTETIKIKTPTIGQIYDYGEEEYFSMLSRLIATPFDMIVFLDNLGIDFTTITDYQLFCMLAPLMSVDETSILFGDIDFTKFRCVNTENGVILLNTKNTSAIISEPIYKLMVDYLRKIHCLAPPKYKKVGNEFTKKKFIEYAYEDLKYASKRKYKSPLFDAISFFVAESGGDYGKVWDMSIFAFYDTIKRFNAIEYTRSLLCGMYSGNIDTSKIKKSELDFMRSLD